jgi:carboxylesterase
MMSDDNPTKIDPDGPHSVLVLHGLGGGRFELAPLIDALEEAGCRVASPVLPGHAVDGSIMPASNWEDWIKTAELTYDELASFGRPVVVVGFSTGGTLALLLATRRPVARLILLAPFLAIRYVGLIPFRPASYIGPIARILPNLPRRSPPARDREARRLLEKVVRFRTFSLKATLSALELIERVKPLVGQIQTPTLILQGKLDSVVDPAGAVWLFNHLSSPDKELSWFLKSDHLLALDHERALVVAMARDFALLTMHGKSRKISPE